MTDGAAARSTTTKRKVRDENASDIASADAAVAAAEAEVERCGRELAEAQRTHAEAAKKGDFLALIFLERAVERLEVAKERKTDAEKIKRLTDGNNVLTDDKRLLAQTKKLFSAITRVMVQHTVVSSSSASNPSAEQGRKHAQKKSKPDLVVRQMIEPVFETTIDGFFRKAVVADCPAALTDAALDDVMNRWWSRAREFKLPESEFTFAQLLSRSLAGEKMDQVKEVAPVFASLMFELMMLLDTPEQPLFLYSEAKLLKLNVRWPSLAHIAPSRRPERARMSDADSENSVASNDGNDNCVRGGSDDDHCRDDAADLLAVKVPRWLVHVRDGNDLNTHRKVDLAVFAHKGPRDACSFNLCSQRSVCTAVELKRDVDDPSLRKAISQLTQDYAITISTQFVGERRVLFGIVGTAAQLRFCQLWSRGAHCEARVSPLVSIATAKEVAKLLANPRAEWCDVVAGRSTLLRQIARVVLYSASGPTIDCGLKLPSGSFSTEIGELQFTGVLGCTTRSIVLSADLRKDDGSTMRVALKRYCESSDGSRECEIASLRKFGHLPGVVSLVGDSGDLEWIATAPVGVALSQMCLCSNTARDRASRALKDGLISSLLAIHANKCLFADVHPGNIVLIDNADANNNDVVADVVAKFVDLESVREEDSEKRPSPPTTLTDDTAHADMAALDDIIRKIEQRL